MPRTAPRTFSKQNWSTEDELRFLRGLGAHHVAHRMQRQALLHKYLDAMPRRADWGTMDTAHLTAAVQDMLRLPRPAIIMED